MIFDAFSFFNELELLDLRLHELSDFVDYFILVEATKTHSGLDKPLYYDLNKEVFSDFKGQIIHVVVDNMPMSREELDAAITPQDRVWIESGYQVESHWVRERFQRNAMMRVLNSADADDIVIIEDADELVRPSVISSFYRTVGEGSYAIGQTLYNYFMNWKCVNMPWWGSKVLRRRCITNPSEHRFHTPPSGSFPNSGWHFGFLGGDDRVKQKLISYAHQEFNDPKILGNTKELVEQGKDALGRLYKYEIVSVDESYPQYVQDNPELFRKFMR